MVLTAAIILDEVMIEFASNSFIKAFAFFFFFALYASIFSLEPVRRRFFSAFRFSRLGSVSIILTENRNMVIDIATQHKYDHQKGM